MPLDSSPEPGSDSHCSPISFEYLLDLTVGKAFKDARFLRLPRFTQIDTRPGSLYSLAGYIDRVQGQLQVRSRGPQFPYYRIDLGAGAATQYRHS